MVVVVAVSCAIFFGMLFGLAGAIPAILVLGLLLLYFRDPSRVPPALPLALICPLDGIVISVGVHHDPWLDRESVKVILESGLFDVHSLFSPTEGKLIEQWAGPKYPQETQGHSGKVLACQIRTDEGDDVVLEVAQGIWRGSVSLARRLGERVGHGHRVGFAPFGCTVAIYAPGSSRVEVSVGGRVTAALTTLMTLVRGQNTSSPASRTTE